MKDDQWLAERFAERRGHLWWVAYRMLGSRAEADEAVEDTLQRLGRARSGELGSLGGWTTAIVARGVPGLAAFPGQSR